MLATVPIILTHPYPNFPILHRRVPQFHPTSSKLPCENARDPGAIAATSLRWVSATDLPGRRNGRLCLPGHGRGLRGASYAGRITFPGRTSMRCARTRRRWPIFPHVPSSARRTSSLRFRGPRLLTTSPMSIGIAIGFWVSGRANPLPLRGISGRCRVSFQGSSAANAAHARTTVVLSWVIGGPIHC